MRGKLARRPGDTIVYGTLVTLPEPAIVDVLGRVGFDFAVADMEHGPLDLRTLEYMVRAGTLSGMPVLVRVGEIAESLILRVLETGAAGIVAPHVRSASDAAKLVALCRYPPEGTRGACRVTAATGYGEVPFHHHVEGSNRRVWIAAMIEDTAGLDHLDAILEVDGLDAIWPGPVDLAASIGLPGQVDATPVVEAINLIMRKAHDKDSLDIAAYVTTLSQAERWSRRGANVLIYSIDARVIGDAYRETLEQLRQAVAPGVP
jgi:4-hydroxy-2-oxoheptanedioate aldolase